MIQTLLQTSVTQQSYDENFFLEHCLAVDMIEDHAGVVRQDNTRAQGRFLQMDGANEEQVLKRKEPSGTLATQGRSPERSWVNLYEL